MVRQKKTGIKDINGVEIYEYDIIDFIKNGKECETPCYIKWHPYLTMFYLCFSYEDKPKETDSKSSLGEMIYKHGYKVKVLGNIYDDPDLIPELSPYIICK